jgi:hypothetical protein
MDLIRHLSRAQLLEVAAELSDESLRAAVAAVVSSSQAAPAAVAPTVAPAKPATAAPTVAPKAPKAKAPKAATDSEDAMIDAAIAELAPLGFARADLAAATGIEAGAPKLKRAIDRAVEGKTLVKVGEKRFTRYGATKAIAEAAKARG